MADAPAIPTSDRLLEIACAAARAAGRHAHAQSARRRETIATFAHDVKLALDVECQAIAEREIRAAFPTHAFLGEESDGATAIATLPSDQCVWVVDPIDGTVNFSHGFPRWCCSVAVRAGARTLAGAVYAPETDHLYTATDDGPATRNGRRLRVSPTVTPADALVLTGIDKNVRPGLAPLALFERLSSAVRKARITGSAALDLCSVAAGEADGYFETGIYLWDIAAAGLIIERAGGRCEVLLDHGGHRMAYLADNGHLHDTLRGLIAPLL